ncbi:hypothetical protein ACMHYQ_11325 [Ectopseudomonas guguanensis]|jgi:hypothetical protein|uniref:Uncharacterized protein n=2 Tax=Ectopseudomonas guguanensis TaxID=1198456 RepID=A0A1H0UYI4_9GAMM|nr:hypothetical protein [Pseudomonas guguanensis]MDR8013183.1 hypothetical protein [Pseudomonas guguanensis]MPT16478.1 hypothetical protein [Pseudomonas sp.]WJH55039.1 hypothetical protein FE254_02335 [Pseudomonas guguanensis]SDP71227.1 hypothetical protein SAMN05216213_105119 [Pseudomonas guguanensis]
MRIASVACFATLAFACLSSHATEVASLQAKCQEQMAANQDGLAQLKQLAALSGNDKAKDNLAALDGGCERLNAEAGASQAAAPDQLNGAVESVNATKDALKGLSSMFGK